MKKLNLLCGCLTSFLDAMGGHMPVCLITDQDPAMKVAIEAKFFILQLIDIAFGIS